MAKLYPPYIEGTLPAFGLDKKGDGTIVIPFSHNKAVSPTDIGSRIAMKVKAVQNDVLMTTGEPIYGVYDPIAITVTFNVKNYIVEGYKDFNVKVGQYYKIQLAYTDKFLNYNNQEDYTKEEIGYYSTVGVIKCTSIPQVSIIGSDGKELSQSAINNNSTVFTGKFTMSEGQDVTEKLYSSYFTITDLQGNSIIDDDLNKTILHNVENDVNSYEALEEIEFHKDLNPGQVYKLQFHVETNNGLKVNSPLYLLTQQKSLAVGVPGDLIAKPNYDEGYVSISISAPSETISSGAFVLAREDADNPNFWMPLTQFALKSESPNKELFKDFTIEQGKTYTYSIQQYNDHGIYSDRKKSNKVYADFEDMFLFALDEEGNPRQLKLQFNPQVSNFKTQLPETHTETIGSKYPFFYRNAKVGYKVFPISALISMLSDENEFFDTKKSIDREDFPFEHHDTEVTKRLHPEVYDHRWLNGKNYKSERLFKMDVLDWFNDGKVKLFKSPSEGNYLVRLMDTSLVPNDATGRMIHTISTTAYECAEYNYKNLEKYNIIDKMIANQQEAFAISYTTNWVETDISEKIYENTHQNPSTAVPFFNENGESANLIESDIDDVRTTCLKITDMMPGTKFRIHFLNNTNEIITIGASGNYYADDLDPAVTGIFMIRTQDTNPLPSLNGGKITYQYAVPSRSSFNSVTKIETSNDRYLQFVGPIDIDQKKRLDMTGLIEKISSVHEQATKICMSNYRKRPVGILYYRDGNRKVLYRTSDYKTEDIVNMQDLASTSPFALYLLHDETIDNENFFDHLIRSDGSIEETNDKSVHNKKHMFEKFYIDRLLNAQSPEDTLTILTQAARDENINVTYYVYDAWMGYEYVNFTYDPSIYIKYGSQIPTKIDLRELQSYSIDNIENFEKTAIGVGNGVYGEVFYQAVTTDYSFETNPGSLSYAKKEYNETKDRLE